MTDQLEYEDKNLFKIHSTKCVSCIHLFPTHPRAKSHNSCHYSKGNNLCPAQEVQIVVAVDKKSAIENLKESFLSDDIVGAIEQLNKLSRKPVEERLNILSKVFDTEIKPKSKKKKD